MVKAVVNKNGEIEFTNEAGNFKSATAYEVLDRLADGNDCGIDDGDLVQVKEGIGIVNDDNGFEMIIRVKK